MFPQPVDVVIGILKKSALRGEFGNDDGLMPVTCLSYKLTFEHLAQVS